MTRTRSTLLLAFAFATACSLKRPATLPAPAAAPEASAPQVTRGVEEEPLLGLAATGIAMEVRSWGRLIAAFNVDESGMVEYREKGEGNDFYNYDVRTKRFQVGRDGFAALKAMTEPIAAKTRGRGLDCRSVPSDGPYAKFRWRWEGSEGALDVRYGCPASEGGDVVRLIDGVEKTIIEWARTRPVIRVHEVRAPTG